MSCCRCDKPDIGHIVTFQGDRRGESHAFCLGHWPKDHPLPPWTGRCRVEGACS